MLFSSAGDAPEPAAPLQMRINIVYTFGYTPTHIHTELISSEAATALTRISPGFSPPVARNLSSAAASERRCLRELEHITRWAGGSCLWPVGHSVRDRISIDFY